MRRMLLQVRPRVARDVLRGPVGHVIELLHALVGHDVHVLAEEGEENGWQSQEHPT